MFYRHYFSASGNIRNNKRAGPKTRFFRLYYELHKQPRKRRDTPPPSFNLYSVISFVNCMDFISDCCSKGSVKYLSKPIQYSFAPNPAHKIPVIG